MSPSCGYFSLNSGLNYALFKPILGPNLSFPIPLLQINNINLKFKACLGLNLSLFRPYYKLILGLNLRLPASQDKP